MLIVAVYVNQGTVSVTDIMYIDSDSVYITVYMFICVYNYACLYMYMQYFYMYSDCLGCAVLLVLLFV